MKNALAVARFLVASQAQDFAGAKWALGLRTAGDSDADVEAVFNRGEILRTHVLRPTWHFVPQEDLRWLLELTGPSVLAHAKYRLRQLDLDVRTLRKAADVMARALEGGNHLTRDELRAALHDARLRPDGQRLAYMLMFAELEAVICSGPRIGKQFSYALFDERAPRAKSLPRAEALAELSLRYFTSRGPATPHDFAKWSGLPISDAKKGLSEVAAQLAETQIDGMAYWSAKRVGSTGGNRADLLSVYDEYMCSYRDRSAICAPQYAKRLVSQGAALSYLLVLEGQICGTWKRSFTKNGVALRVTPFRKLSGTERSWIEEAAQRFARFYGAARRAEVSLAGLR